ncbi:unnamed protein product [Fusarium venenatum]|uniref:Uncharacterized protein n=1 Tax=Fusarium venenatum TaxID=56646 RepID=A0A2L2TP88_9HYPO|nr:uncharacterized protein FVRRES_04123 [Fusarium venenatum]CEI67611.1 unnamed protein product [Fusarium venenatum]
MHMTSCRDSILPIGPGNTTEVSKAIRHWEVSIFGATDSPLSGPVKPNATPALPNCSY